MHYDSTIDEMVSKGTVSRWFLIPMIVSTIVSLCGIVMLGSYFFQCQVLSKTSSCHDTIASLRNELSRQNDLNMQVVVGDSTKPTRITIDPNDGQRNPGTYPQLGYLKSSSEQPNVVLPLYGMKSTTRRGRGFYYTIVPGTVIKVPVHTTDGVSRDCMDGVGCDELVGGDQVTVPDAMNASRTSQDSRWTVVVYKYNRS